MATGDIIIQIEQSSGKHINYPIVPIKGYYIRFNEKNNRPEAAPINMPNHQHPEYEFPTSIDCGEIV